MTSFLTIENPFGDQIPGTLCLPAAKACAPAVLLLHGFASHKDEVGGFFTRLSAGLAHLGIASFRFTFKGFAGPPETLVRTTVDEMIAEAIDAQAALAADSRIEPARTGLLGFSLGGAVAVLAAARQPARFKALATWSCAADLETSFRRTVGTEQFDRALDGEDIRADLGWRKILLSTAFLRSLQQHHPLEHIRQYPGPFLAVAGSDDPLSAYLDPYHNHSAGPVKYKLLIPGADHIFNVLAEPERFAPLVIDRTAVFFAEVL